MYKTILCSSLHSSIIINVTLPQKSWLTVSVAVRPVSSASSLNAAVFTSSPDSSRPEGGSSDILSVCEDEEAYPYHAVMYLLLSNHTNQSDIKQVCQQRGTLRLGGILAHLLTGALYTATRQIFLTESPSGFPGRGSRVVTGWSLKGRIIMC